MGNICTSPKNNLSHAEQRPIRNTETQNNLISSGRYNHIDKWDVDDVYSWLSTIDDGALYELACKFREARIRGRILDNVTELQLVEMDVPLGDRMHFKTVRSELFSKCNYMQKHTLMDQHSNHSHIGSSNHSHHSSIDKLEAPGSAINNMTLGEGIINTMANDDMISIHSHHSKQSYPHMSQHPQPQPQIPPTHAVEYKAPSLHHMRTHQSVPLHSPIMAHPHPYPHPHPHPYANNVNRGIPVPYVPPSTQLQSSSSHNSNVAVNIDTIEENQYAAVEPQFMEGFEDYSKKKSPLSNQIPPRRQPQLKRAASADEYKKNSHLVIKSHAFKSASNPTVNNHNSKLVSIMKIANLLKSFMQNEAKTGAQIIEILGILSDKDKEKNNSKDVQNANANPNQNKKYKQICELLLKYNLLTEIPLKTDDTVHEFDLSQPYEFNHSVYDSMVPPNESYETSHNVKVNNNSGGVLALPRSLSNTITMPNNMSSIHTNSERKFCGGTQVSVYSPKSCKWRQGLILNFDEITKKGRICCYNSMGKKSIKDLSLPSPLVSVTPFNDSNRPAYQNTHRHTNIHAHTQPQPQMHVQPQPQPQPQPQIQAPAQTQPQTVAPQQHLAMTVDSWNNFVRDRDNKQLY